MKGRLFVGILMLWAALGPRVAVADQASPDDAGEDPLPDAGDDSEVPLACDGALCDTSNGSTCSMSPRGTVETPAGTTAFAALALACFAGRRRRAMGSRR